MLKPQPPIYMWSTHACANGCAPCWVCTLVACHGSGGPDGGMACFIQGGAGCSAHSFRGVLHLMGDGAVYLWYASYWFVRRPQDRFCRGHTTTFAHIELTAHPQCTGRVNVLGSLGQTLTTDSVVDGLGCLYIEFKTVVHSCPDEQSLWQATRW